MYVFKHTGALALSTAEKAGKAAGKAAGAIGGIAGGGGGGGGGAGGGGKRGAAASGAEASAALPAHEAHAWTPSTTLASSSPGPRSFASRGLRCTWREVSSLWRTKYT